MTAAPLDLAQFEGHTPDSMVAAIRLAIEDHKAGKLIDWPFVDSLNAAIPDLYAKAALLAECRRLQARDKALSDQLRDVTLFIRQACEQKILDRAECKPLLKQWEAALGGEK